jgi:hypothetical protein
MSKLKKLNKTIAKKVDNKKSKKKLEKFVEGIIRNKHFYYSTLEAYKTSFDKITGNVEILLSVSLNKKFRIKSKNTDQLNFRFNYIPANVNLKSKKAHALVALTGVSKDKTCATVVPHALGIVDKYAKHILDEFRRNNSSENKIILEAIASKVKKTEVKITGKKSSNGKIKASAKSAGKKPIKNNNKKKVTTKRNKK